MIFFLNEFLKAKFGYHLPAVFEYNSTRMMLSAMTSLILCVFLGPYLIKKLNEFKIGDSVRSEADHCAVLGKLHQKKQNTPTMGGVLIIFSMIVSLLLWMDLTHIFTLILFLTTVILGGLGAIDDYLKLRYKNSKGLVGRKKLLIQVFLGGALALYLLHPTLSQSMQVGEWFTPPVVKEAANASSGITTLTLKEYASRVYVPFFKEPVVLLTGGLTLLGALFMIFVLTGASNAVNLTDGLDGLASGCIIMVATCLAFIAFVSNNIDIARYLHILYIEGSGEIAIYLCACAGACLGFLWYNGYPAQVFMGDTGSLALGGVIGVSSILLKKEFLLAIVGGIFVMEALSVIIQVLSFRYRNKRRVFLCTPIHHHFEYKGWPETKVVIRFWIVGLLLAILGLASLKFQ